MTPDQQAFLDKVVPLAKKEARYAGILPSLTLAQAIIESNWGRSILAQQGHNYFGIKGDYLGQSVRKDTKEWVGGGYVTVTAAFRKYPSMKVGFADHSTFLHKDRYQPLWGVTDYRDACRIIRECGYATSPTYTTTLINTIESYDLDQYDKDCYKMKIYLSPSSQERNIYATGQTEENVCRQIAAKVSDILTKVAGIEVKINQPQNSPAQHADESNAWGANLHLPIHTNAGGAHGSEVFCWEPADLAAVSTKLAYAISAHLSALTPTTDRGVKKNQEFAEIRLTRAPCVYTEIAFHDNKTDAQWIVSHISEIAEAIASAVLNTIGRAHG